jgi:hypothetical protein
MQYCINTEDNAGEYYLRSKKLIHKKNRFQNTKQSMILTYIIQTYLGMHMQIQKK